MDRHSLIQLCYIQGENLVSLGCQPDLPFSLRLLLLLGIMNIHSSFRPNQAEGFYGINCFRNMFW
jgi:hypothetical protein